MFKWLAILCCHLVCGGGEAKSPCKSYANLKRKRLGHQMIHGKAIWKPGIGEITKASRCTAPGPRKESLQHLTWTPSCKDQCADICGLWLISIKLNHLWKTEVSKSAWIKPWKRPTQRDVGISEQKKGVRNKILQRRE